MSLQSRADIFNRRFVFCHTPTELSFSRHTSTICWFCFLSHINCLSFLYLSRINRSSFVCHVQYQPFYLCFFSVTYQPSFRCARYDQVKKEWYNPIQHNSFALPFLNCILMSWLVTRWTGASFSGDLAKVLFWLGTVPLSVLTIFTIARCALMQFSSCQGSVLPGVFICNFKTCLDYVLPGDGPAVFVDYFHDLQACLYI